MRDGRGEERREMIEAIAHDPGKASRARFGDHAVASAELLMRTGFGDEASLRLFERECGTGSMEICGNMPFRGSNPGGAMRDEEEPL